jgi:hypothetical protein
MTETKAVAEPLNAAQSAAAEPIPWTLTLQQAHDEILQCMLQGSAGYHRIGRLYNCVVARRLAVNAGYRTTREYFRQHVRVFSHATLVMFGAVARRFPQAVCERYGMVRLGLLLEYERHAPVSVNAREPGGVSIELPRRGGLLLARPFAACTAEELREAILHQRSRPRGPQAEAQQEHLQRFCDTLGQYLSENASGPVKVEPRTGPWWKVRVHLRNLLLSDMERLTEALQRGFTHPPPSA